MNSYDRELDSALAAWDFKRIAELTTYENLMERAINRNGNDVH